MPSYMTSIGAAAGTLLGVLNTGWAFWKAYKDRARLLVEVDWDYIAGDHPEETSSPRVTIFNSGGRKVYIAETYLAELEECAGIVRCMLRKPKLVDRHVWPFDQLENPELQPDRSCPSRQCNWNYEEQQCWPEFNRGWAELRVVVRAEGGKDAKKWRSKAPTTEPSWFSRFSSTHEHRPAFPPGVSH